MLHVEDTLFYIITSPKNPVMFGFPWFQCHNPRINYKEGELTHWSTYCRAHRLRKVLTRSCHSDFVESPEVKDEVPIPCE